MRVNVSETYPAQHRMAHIAPEDVGWLGCNPLPFVDTAKAELDPLEVRILPVVDYHIPLLHLGIPRLLGILD